MEIHEFFVQRWEAEQRAFAAVLRALPSDQLSYRPHERSMSAGALAWQLAQEQGHLVDLLDKGKIVWENEERPESLDGIIARWDASTATVRERLKTLDAKKAAEPADFAMGGQSVWTDTVNGMLWGYLFDMVHHRGQLSSYIRPMGGKVPSIYGPSGDDAGE